MLKKALIITGSILIALNILISFYFIYQGNYNKLDSLIAWCTFGFFYVNMMEDEDS